MLHRGAHTRESVNSSCLQYKCILLKLLPLVSRMHTSAPVHFPLRCNGWRRRRVALPFHRSLFAELLPDLSNINSSLWAMKHQFKYNKLFSLSRWRLALTQSFQMRGAVAVCVGSFHPGAITPRIYEQTAAFMLASPGYARRRAHPSIYNSRRTLTRPNYLWRQRCV